MLLSILEITGILYAIRELYCALAMHLIVIPIAYVLFSETPEPDLCTKALSFAVFDPALIVVVDWCSRRLCAKQPEGESTLLNKVDNFTKHYYDYKFV